MAATGPGSSGQLSSGVFNGNLGTLYTEAFTGKFESLRDTEKTFIARFPKDEATHSEYRYIVEDATYAAIWSATEAMMLNTISATNLATDGLGSATAILAPASHPVIRANVPMRYHYFATQLTGVALASVNSPAALVNYVKETTTKTIDDFWRAQNIRALSTSTSAGNSGRNLDPIGVILRTGAVTYANINASTYPSWAVASDTATTVLSVGSMQTLINKVEGGTETLVDALTGSGHAEADLTIREGSVEEIWCSPTRADDYFNLMEGYRRFSPEDTLDAGGAANAVDTGLTFKGRKILSFKRFPAAWLVMYGGGIKLVEFGKVSWADKSAVTVDSRLMVGKWYGNLVARHRRHGVMTALT